MSATRWGDLGPPEVRFGVNYLMLQDDPRCRPCASAKRSRPASGLRISDLLSLAAQARRNLEADTTIFHKFGLVYNHPCLQVIGGVERNNTNDRDAEETTTFSFRVTLKHLGQIGQDPDLF